MDVKTVTHHTCHARGCRTACKPEFLMCPMHWRMVPQVVQKRVYRAYRPGQCSFDPLPSEAWRLAANDAILAVARKEYAESRSSQPDPGSGTAALEPWFGSDPAPERRIGPLLSSRLETIRDRPLPALPPQEPSWPGWCPAHGGLAEPCCPLQRAHAGSTVELPRHVHVAQQEDPALECPACFPGPRKAARRVGV